MLEWHKAFSCACLQGADPSYRLGICASVFLPALECKPLPFLLVCVVFYGSADLPRAVWGEAG